ncbi:Ig-like domain-containing protein [Flavobacterium gelatinilyticum]|uniref:Ig-like domain-containing protein n=1 Tax=Flavobacterium gelatinilyticum TaxID=3003260 RepID=UPI00248058A9|nr:Ig-like domain-containing protein [Flavobacterium gelatinilyticum]
MLNKERTLKQFLVGFLFLCSLSGYSQTNISGIVNSYFSVVGINQPNCDPCDLSCINTITVTNAAGLVPGDKALIIQMKGAEIDLTNTIEGGKINRIHNTGNYEFFEIKSITGNVLTPMYPLLKNYTLADMVQVVRVPKYTGQVNITAELTAKDWNTNDKNGGVLAIQAGRVVFNADINVAGKGYEGIQMTINGPNNDCDPDPNNLYVLSNTATASFTKGDGIVIDNINYNRGRAPRANGGGSGVAGDSGGGGGSNYGAGGEGGKRWCNVNGTNAGGLGGVSLASFFAQDKVFLGGAGGSGYVTTNNPSSAADGGGIVIIFADEIVGNGHSIIADGFAPLAVNPSGDPDGGGGGGAGGTVVLKTPLFTGNLAVSAKGGDGQDLNTNTIHGPGGGGGGGALLYSLAALPPNVTLNANGGVGGVHLNGERNGSEDGLIGGSVSLYIPVENPNYMGIDDEDGLDIECDLDDDNDGILDSVEIPAGLPDPFGDHDNDKKFNFIDKDAPGFVDNNKDGIDDRYDEDLDGIINQFDLDSDNDGCPDAIEAYGTTNADPDNNGFYGTGNPPPTHPNGTVVAASYTAPVNTNGTSKPNYLVSNIVQITTSPVNADTNLGGNATFSGVVTGTHLVYVWKQSIDGGANWTTVTDGGTNPTFSNADTNSLTLTNIPRSFNNYQYRLDVTSTSNACAQPNSAAARLRVVNRNPVAVNDIYTVQEDNTLTLNPLNGDTDADGDTLTITSINGTALTGFAQTITVDNGTVDITALGVITFIPDADFNSATAVVIPYSIEDGFGGTANAEQRITVTAVNDAPVALADNYTVAEGGTINVNTADGVLSNDSDAEGDAITAILVANPSHGSLTLNADGSFDYTHDGSETTSDSFTYKVNDGTIDGNTVAVTITVTPVNDAPVALADNYTVAEGGTINVNTADGVLSNDSDAEGDAITAVLVTNPSHGSLTLNADGSFDYTHDGSETTSDSFTYKVNDGTIDGNTVAVTITVTPVNDAPVALADNYTVAEGGTINVNTADGVLSNDSDAEGDAITAVLVANPSHGSLTLNADGSFDYTHDGSETTTDSFTYHANDGTVNGNTVTVTITVTPVNDAPIAVNNTYTVAEDNSITVNPLSGDSDPEGDTLSLVSINGTLLTGSDQTITVSHGKIDITSGIITFIPDADFNSTTPITIPYVISDGHLTATADLLITVTAVNDAPVALADNYTVAEGGTINVNTADGVLSNDSDAEGDAITAILVTNPSHGSLTLNADGSFDYTHDGSETTTDSFTYKVNDGTIDGNTVAVTITVTPVNDAPIALADNYTVAEGGTINVNTADGVLSNDSDAEGDAITAILVTNPSHGSLTLNADGSFDYTHDGSETTTDSFTYKVNDGTIDGNTVAVTITVTPVNDAPIALADNYTVAEGGTINVNTADGVLSNDSDAEGDAITAVLVANPSHGSLTLNADGSFDYTHDGSETTSDSFTYKVNDGTVDGNTIAVTITVTPVNDAPVALADNYTVAEGGTINVNTADGVLSNDSDAEGDAITAILVANPSHGTLTLNADGSFDYTHDGSETTTDSFTYKVNDGTIDGNTVAVTITVTPVNDAPVALADNYTVAEGGTINVNTADGVLSNDSDAEGDAITAILVANPSHGTLTLNADGSFDYTHDGSETTTDSFTYKVNDGTIDGNTVAVTITVTPVNDAPVALADNYTVAEGGTINVNTADGVLSNDSDAEGDAITAILVANPSHGTLTLNADGSFDYTHDGSETTTDSFTYKVNDGTVDGNTVAVTITVTPVNDAPVALADNYTVAEGGTINVNTADGVLSNDSDAEGDAITAILVANPSHGTLTLNADGSFDYTHDGSETTTDSFTYKVNDGTIDGNTVAVTITVTPVNDAPVALADNYTVAEGGTINVNTADGVLSNDSDAEGDAITAILVTNPSHGSLTLNADGSFDYTHDGSETTTDSFTYKVNDGTIDGNTVAVTITVTPVNDAPIALADNYTVAEGGTINVNTADGVLSNDSDAEGDAITAILVTNPSHGSLTLNADGSFDYTHDGSETTTDSFTYKVNDGTIDGNTVAVTITVTPVNDAPIALADNYTVAEGGTINVNTADGVLSNDSDAEGDAITAVLVANPSHGSLTLNADGSFDYTHDGSETTSDSFTYKVNDGTVDGNTIAVTITVTPVNDAPVALADNYTVAEGGTINVNTADGVLSNDSDAEGDAITAILVANPSHGTLTLNADGSFDYTHDGSETTTDSFTYKVNDGTIDGNTVAVTITVTPVNDAPVALADNYTVAEGGTINVNTADGVLSNDSDAEGDAITAILVANPSHGTLTLNADGSFDYTHDGSETTTDSFTYKVNDGTIDGNTVAVTITVTPVNDAPVALADNYTVAEGGTINVNTADGVLSNDSDAEGDAITAILVANPSHGTLTLNADGSFDYTHDGSETTTDSFTYKVNDGTVDGNTVAVTITVTPVNDAPVALADNYTVAEGGTINVNTADGVLSNDSDAEGDAITAILVANPSHGTLTLNADGSFDYTHDGSETTTDSFTYKVNDGTIDGNTVAVTITVTPVNDAPVALADNYTVAEGGTINVNTADGVLSNDSDAEGDAITAVLVANPSHGSLTLNADGSFDYTHDGSETTSDSFTYKVNDGTIDGNTVTVTITVTPVNDAPVANSDTNANIPSTAGATVINALSATDVDGTITGYTVLTLPANGVLALSGTPITVNQVVTPAQAAMLTYAPSGTFTGLDTFTFSAEDNLGAVSNTAVVTIPVGNNAPVAIDDTNSNIKSRAGATAINALTAADSDGTIVNYIILTLPSNGVLALSGTPITVNQVLTPAQAAMLTYDPSGAFSGNDSFTFTATDNNGAVDATPAVITIPVEKALLIAVKDEIGSVVGINKVVEVVNVLDNDTLDNDPLQLSDINLNVTTPDPDNILTLRPDGMLELAPNAPAGTYTLTYEICEKANSGNCTSATVSVTVTAPAMTITAGSYCLDNAAYVAYNVTADNFTPTGLLTINWIDSSGRTVATQNNMPLSGDVLWPGTVLGTDNKPTDWPGWVLSNGQWTEGNDGFELTRPAVTMEFTINPTQSVTVNYPDASSGCSARPQFGIEAGNDDDIALADGLNGSLEVINVLDNDKLNGVPVNPADVVLTGVNFPDGITLNEDGTIDVAPGTAPGNHTLTYQICEKANGNNCSTATVQIFVEVPAITLIMDVKLNDENGNGNVEAGETLTYTFIIKNTGNVPLENILISDLIPGVVMNGGPITLAVGQSDSTTFTGTYTLTQTDINSGSVSNQGTVSGITQSGIIVLDKSDSKNEGGNNPTVIELNGCNLKIYNAVSLNGDDKNERFYIRGIECYPDNTVQIFNRWGVLVFERDHYNNNDVVFKGYSEGRTTVKESNGLPEGTYYYIVRYKDNASKPKQEAGYLYLTK